MVPNVCMVPRERWTRKGFSDFALLDAVPGEVGADELSILTLDNVQAVVEEDCFSVGADEPHAVPHASALEA